MGWRFTQKQRAALEEVYGLAADAYQSADPSPRMDELGEALDTVAKMLYPRTNPQQKSE